MPTSNRRQALIRLGALASIPCTLSAQAQSAPGTYPAKPVRLIVPDPAGGLPSNFARLIAEPLSRQLGQPIIVDNKPGAGGSIGTRAMLQEPADGYTLLFTYISNQVITALIQKPAPYHPVNDFAPIALCIVNTGGFMVVNAALPIHTPRELFAYAKANPGRLNFASAGVGSITHLAIELIKNKTGSYIVHIPFNGPTPAMLAVVNGDADFAIAGSLAAALPFVASGKVRLLARLGEKRSPDYPDVATLFEDTVPGLIVPFWMGFTARTGTPADIVARLNREINHVLASDTNLRKIAATSYLETVEGPPSLLRDVVARDFETFGKVVRDNHITVNS